MSKFEIRYALNGSFGGCEMQEWEVIEAPTLEKAMDAAYQAAVDEYDSYGGLHGLRGIEEIMDEEGVDETEAEQILQEEREGWLDYDARPFQEPKP